MCYFSINIKYFHISPLWHRLLGNSVKIKTENTNITRAANIFMDLLHDTCRAKISSITKHPQQPYEITLNIVPITELE